MACLAALIFTSFGAGHVLASASTEEQLKGSLIRRHQDEEVSEVRLGAHGDMSLSKKLAPKLAPKLKTKAIIDTNSCNLQFFILPVQTPAAAGSKEVGCPPHSFEVDNEEDCFYAGAHSEHFYPTATQVAVADDHNKSLSTNIVNPLPYVKNCLVYHGKVYFNPSDKTTGPGGTGDEPWLGQKVCRRELYPRANKTAGGIAGTCPTFAAEFGGDFVPVNAFVECERVWFCDGGGESCRTDKFMDNAAYTADPYAKLPKGCFERTNGCMDYNYIAAMPTTVTEGIQLCQPGSEFHPPPGPEDGWKRGSKTQRR